MKLAKGDRTRGLILERAIQMASVVGLDGLSIGDLAARLELSKSGLYAHFRSKEALQLAILRRGIRTFGEIVIADAQRRRRGVETLRALFRGWMHWSHDRLDGGCLFVTAAVEFDDRPGPVRDYLVTEYRRWFAVIEEAARRAIADGDFRQNLDCEQFAHDFHAITLGYNHADRLFHDPKAERRARHALDRLLKEAKR